MVTLSWLAVCYVAISFIEYYLHGVFMHQELFSIGGEIGELMHHFPAL